MMLPAMGGAAVSAWVESWAHTVVGIVADADQRDLGWAAPLATQAMSMHAILAAFPPGDLVKCCSRMAHELARGTVPVLRGEKNGQ